MTSPIKTKANEKKFLTQKEAADLLGLKYNYARKLLLQDMSIGFYDYQGKRLWARCELIAFRDKHYVKPQINGGE